MKKDKTVNNNKNKSNKVNEFLDDIQLEDNNTSSYSEDEILLTGDFILLDDTGEFIDDDDI